MRTALLLALVIAAPAFSQTGKAKTQTEKKAPVTEIKFGEGSAIMGDRDVPQELRVDSIRPPPFPNLIKVRENFSDKLMESVYEL